MAGMAKGDSPGIRRRLPTLKPAGARLPKSKGMPCQNSGFYLIAPDFATAYVSG